MVPDGLKSPFRERVQQPNDWAVVESPTSRHPAEASLPTRLQAGLTASFIAIESTMCQLLRQQSHAPVSWLAPFGQRMAEYSRATTYTQPHLGKDEPGLPRPWSVGGGPYAVLVALPRTPLPSRRRANERARQPPLPRTWQGRSPILTAGGSSGEIGTPADFTCALF